MGVSNAALTAESAYDNRPQLAINGGLRDLVLRAEQKAEKDQKEVNALKRVLCQNGVRIEG